MLGAHISKNGEKTIEEAVDKTRKYVKEKYGLEMKAAQIFVSNPYKPFEDAKLTGKFPENMRIYSHGSYTALFNLSEYSKNGIVHQMKRCNEFEIRGLVVHLTGIPKEQIANMITEIFASLDKKLTKNEENKCCLFIEHVVPKNKEYAYSEAEEINELMKYVIKKNKGRKIGFCLDTCHMWANGKDISSYEKAREFFSKLDKKIDFLCHLNDCELPLDNARDRHAPLGTKIWSEPYEKSGLMAVLEFCKERKIDFILERNKKYGINQDLLVLEKLMKK